MEERRRRKEDAEWVIALPHVDSILSTAADPFGSTESTRVDGAGVSSFTSWDSKITTVAAYLGGVHDFVASKMKKDGIYDEFINVITVSLPKPKG